MASGMLHFSTNKQIKFGLDDNFIKEQLIDLLTKFESLFDDQPQYRVKFNQTFIFYRGQPKYLRDNGDLAPWEYPNPQLDEQKKDWLKIEISKLIEAGIISKVNEAPKYINSIDVISKNNKFEFNPDFSELNGEKGFSCMIKKRTIKEYLEQIIFSIPSSTIFSKLVIKDAAFQFVLNEKYRKYTSFKLRNDKDDKDEYYQFNRLHPNMKVALIHMQRQYENKFIDLIEQSKLRIFSNELLIFSNSIDDHIDKLNQILMRIKYLDYKISLEDSMILFYEIEIGDYWLDGEGISLSSKIKKKIKDLDPTDREERDWLRSIVYSYKRFCSLSDEDYEKNQKLLVEATFRKKNGAKFYVDTVILFKLGFLNSKKISYEPQSSRQSSKQSSGSDLPQPTQQTRQQISSQILPQISQKNSPLHQYLQQNLKQYLQHNSHLQQYLKQQIIQNFQHKHLHYIIEKFKQQNQQKIIQQFMQQYLQQNKPEYLQSYLKQNTYLQQIIMQFLQQYLQQPNSPQYPP